ncbi:fumarylacetoacetate hydrolase family protein [Streptomyces malaysiensis]|uniref:Fumarylacetoacetate (FAA) hydrolase n=1 Tax=Streptomyces malaysiensis TaxID=92644 RepID=A0A7X6AWC5_STRMQ|nr:fumarylacetoacetate hydrolase family protein [Streptomyces malaysiensis]NIY64086.1 Fumarylacetoacetate (FAA) hydrolase [Streptomyces malaysiensis]
MAASSVEFVPPVLPDARVFRIGLNYLKHVAEGSFSDQELPEHPTLFARWTQSLTVDGAEVPVPAGEDGLDWEGEVAAWVGAPLVEATPDGRIVQDVNTDKMAYGVGETLAHISHTITLRPGDLLATGTPAGVRVVCGEVGEDGARVDDQLRASSVSPRM